MASFSKQMNQIKTAQAALQQKEMELANIPSSASVMGLEVEEPMTMNESTTYADNFMRSNKYLWYNNYSDDKYSYIDENKNISVDASQINLTQEKNSQFIPFEMDRFYDGIDLMQMSILIHYMNIDKEESFANPVNVTYSNTKIRFAWLADDFVTAKKGDVTFEIQAVGVNEKNQEYRWVTRPNGKLNVLQSLAGNGVIEPSLDWTSSFMTQITDKVAEANAAATRAENASTQAIVSANEALEAVEESRVTIEEAKTELELAVDTKVDSAMTEALLNYYTKTEVDTLFENFDISDQLQEVKDQIDNLDGLANFNVTYDGKTMTFYNGESVMKAIEINSDPTEAWTNSFIEANISPINEKVTTIETDLEGIHSSIDSLPETLKTDYYNKTDADAKFATQISLSNTESALQSGVDANKNKIETLSTTVVGLQSEVDSIDKSPRLSYEATYDEEFKYTLWEISGEGDSEVREAKSQFVIQGGSGGGTSSVLKIEYVTKTPLVATVDDKIKITYNFSGSDSSGDAVLEGSTSWKVGGRVVATGTCINGENTFDITEYIAIGTQKVVLTVTDEAGSLVTKSWTVQKIDVRLESTFNDKLTYEANKTLSFDYTPYGAIEKTVHFKLDGKEIGTIETSVSGIPMGYTIPAQNHGAHLFEVYMTAIVNNNTIESNHIFKDILFFDESASSAVIGTIQQNFTALQYDTTNIEYTVYDPKTETPTVELAVDDTVVSTLTLEQNTNTWQFKSDVVGTHVLTITCGDTVKTINVEVEKLDINIEPVTTGLVFDFNPSGKTNADSDRLWKETVYDTNVLMSVSDNFDWQNGGYQIDANGDTYFCIKAGTTADINYKLFADDAKRNGKEFKLIFKTVNVSNENATFLKCLDNTTETNHIGIQMDVHEARIYGMSENLPLPYSEDDIIEFEFNISKNTETPSMIMAYEDGVSTRPMVYTDSHSFTQTAPKTISLGSPDCDLHIYRFKVYNTSLTDRGILNNFIADARNAATMIDRYNRNQIYDENGKLVPEVLAEKCPWLRVFVLETPRFTQDKDDKVPGGTLRCIYKGGDPVLDNWTAVDIVHSGQGTSSNNYGPSGRNLDFILKTYKDLGNNPVITLGDGKTVVKKVSLTRDSVEVNYFNCKVNIASSENANNALLQKRYDRYNPYQRPFVREDETEIPKIKDTMDFYNCVVFLKETDPDLSTHVEFADNEVHYYAFGNIGNSKKTDETRLTDPTDKYECILEVMDNTLPNSTMPTGKVDGNGKPVYPIPESEWTVGNSAYDALYGDLFDESKASDKANGLADTYGWRYIYEDGSDEENAEVREYVQNKWREFYKFVVTSSNEDFKAHLGDYVVLDSVLYYYLYTLRYTMTDNHSKNSFWGYGKSNDKDVDGNPIRKWHLAFDYDNDTALGIDNYGRMSYRYGYEEIDFVDGTKDWVWNAPNHIFFLRIRELFDAELSALYNTLESKGTWSSTSLINEFDAWQEQFPEELWRVDIERKYIRTFTSSYINGEARPEFLKERANGRKKYQRRYFERNQEKYMASKFGSTVASADDIILRCSVPNTELTVAPNFDMHLTPFSHMYLNVKYNTSPPLKVRAVPGETYEIKYDAELADIIELYGASNLKNIGDLSACYLTNGDFANASKITELKLGNDTEGYDNTNVMTLGLGANTLLKKLDIQNMSGLTHALDLNALKNLEELYAHGSNIGGITFANGGKIEIAEIPAVNSITARNLNYLTNLDIESYTNLTTLTVENCSTIDVQNIFELAQNINRVRITGIDWTLTDDTLLDRIYAMAGIDRNGYNVEHSVLAGKVHVPLIKQQKLYDYKEAWPDLEITFDTMIEQFKANFRNEDGTILETQYVDKGGNAIDPLTREENPMAIPTKESTVSHDFTFDKWDGSLTGLFSDRDIYATYTSILREYTVKYVSKGITLQESRGKYGEMIPYAGESNPTYTLEETGYVYYWFDRWDKSGYIDGDKTIEAIFDKCEYTEGYFNDKELSTMRPVEIYAMTKLGLEQTVIEDKDLFKFNLGHDINYDDVKSEVIINEKMQFNGTNHYDTNIKLFDIDKDFVLAIDYEFMSGSTNAVIAQCFQGNGSNGFKLWSNNGIKMTWGTSAVDAGSMTKREMIILRHTKGDYNLKVYGSNLDGETVSIETLTRTKETICDSTLVFGAAKADDGLFENYAVGNIYWSKIWYMDLGEDICKKLAMWVHEEITMEACGFRKYYLTENSSKRCSFSLLATHLLGRTAKFSSASVNEGGWRDSSLRTFLNTRVYNAIPEDIRALIKQVEVPGNIGNKSTEVVNSSCYLTIPACIEVDPNYLSTEPYMYEGTSISYFSTNETRKRAFNGGEVSPYWLRSPNVLQTNYIFTVNAEGKTYGYNYPYNLAGILLQLSI